MKTISLKEGKSQGPDSGAGTETRPYIGLFIRSNEMKQPLIEPSVGCSAGLVSIAIDSSGFRFAVAATARAFDPDHFAAVSLNGFFAREQCRGAIG